MLTISDEYLVSDLSFAAEASGNDNPIHGLFFNSVAFDDEEVLVALRELQGKSYQLSTLFNCSGQFLGEVLSRIMTTMRVDCLFLEYSSTMTFDGKPLFQDECSKAMGQALARGSPVQNLCLSGLSTSLSLGEALKFGLPHSNIKSFEWYQDGNSVGRNLGIDEMDGQNNEFQFWMSLLAGLKSCHTLKQLEFRNVRRDEIMSHYMTTLRKHPSLTYLGVSVKDFGNGIQFGINNLMSLCEENDGIVEMLNQSPLKTLKLSFREKVSAIPSLPKPRHDKLKYILEFINATDRHMNTLGEGLAQNEDVEEVHILDHLLTSEGILKLSSWLGERETKLRKLTMRGSPIGKTGALALLAAVQKNRSWLEVAELPRGTDLRPAIQHFADLNKAGWSRIIRNERSDSMEIRLWPHVIARANNLVLCNKSKRENDARRADTIFHLLRGQALHSAKAHLRPSSCFSGYNKVE
ncbi:hypothetical protein IV203_002824 [Nitzschia inconspicua]|uniref:Uncharacterized protein n=1 Tax=Nitzschia inconspicua TaxID=303405 RepID=A0A9K3L1H7_9STRA|nr:hypothetical protein IV203_002824 [Nitzschia inconspicua]